MARIGLVLGAGGVVGHAFHTGVLASLAEETGWDAREADVVVGTSAGSVVGALLRAGFGPLDLAARAAGDPVSAEAEGLLERMGGPAPAPVPEGPALRRLRVPSRKLLTRAAFRPWQQRAGTWLAAIAPEGRLPTDHIVTGIRRLFPDGWPDDPLWINAVRMDDGRRVVFGRDASADVATAVAASCAVPTYYRPVVIDGAKYVDGGVHSPTNAELLAGRGLDLVVVSSPMSLAPGLARLSLDAAGRAYAWSRLVREIARLRARGTAIVAIEPGLEDLRAMELNPMDPTKRRAIVHRARETATRRMRRRGDVRTALAG